jgi:putative ABC transport system permease protein
VNRTERLRIAGVFDKSDNEYDWSVYMALDDVESMNQWLTGRRRNPREGYNQLLVKADDRESVQTVQQAIRDLGFETYSSMDILRAVNQVFLIMEAILGAIGAVTLIVAAFGIANTMTMAIYERTREIGIMKAIGATNRDVLRIFLFEAGAIGVIGGVLGVLTGLVVGQVIDYFVRTQLAAPPAGAEEEATRLVITPLWLIVFALLFATIVGLISGIYPALRAASMKPLRALRSE